MNKKLYKVRAVCQLTNPEINDFMKHMDMLPAGGAIVVEQEYVITTTTKPTKKLLKGYEKAIMKAEEVRSAKCIYELKND